MAAVKRLRLKKMPLPLYRVPVPNSKENKTASLASTSTTVAADPSERMTTTVAAVLVLLPPESPLSPHERRLDTSRIMKTPRVMRLIDIVVSYEAWSWLPDIPILSLR